MMVGMKNKRFDIKKLGLIVVAGAVFLSLYVYYMAKKQDVIYFKGLNPETVSFEDLTQTMSTTPAAYFFCETDNPDCRYIDTEMINILLIDAHTERFNNLILVDTKTLDSDILPSALLARYGFSGVPAFAILSYENGTIVIHSVLQWSTAEPFTMLDLKDWMKENKLWLPEYTN